MNACRTTLTAVVAAAAAAAAVACGRSASDVDRVLAIRPIALAAPAGSAEPQLSVFDNRAIVSWVDTAETGGTTHATLRFSERTSGDWTPPRVVAAGDDWFVSAADVPSVIRTGDHSLASHWLRSTNELREAYDLVVALSADDGLTWSHAIKPHHDATQTEHGFATLFAFPDHRLGIVWLDGRTTDDPSNDDTSLRAAAFDASRGEFSEALVDERVCECCATAVAMTSDGPLAVFRDRSAAEVRDIAATRFVNGAWTRPAIVHADNWRIEACPINGPAVAAHGRDAAVAWMTGDSEQGHVFAAFSDDAGATFGAPIRIDDTGSPGHVGIALGDGATAFVTWIESSGGRSQWRVRAVDASGRRGAAQAVTTLGAGRAGGYPRIARSGDELLFAWTETAEGRPRVRTAAARLF